MTEVSIGVRQRYQAALGLAAVLHSIYGLSGWIRGAMVKVLQDFDQASGQSSGLILIGPGVAAALVGSFVRLGESVLESGCLLLPAVRAGLLPHDRKELRR